MPHTSKNKANPESSAVEAEGRFKHEQPSDREQMSGATRENTPARSFSSERISERAYQIYCDRGGEHGRDAEDWLAAERELNGTAGEQE